jgi:ATP-dependent DNA helicase RecG
MAIKKWTARVLVWLEESLSPIPHEINELDWKVTISDNRERLIEHLIAFANNPDGGCLVFGINNSGITCGIVESAVAEISNSLANLGRDAVEPALALDHTVIEFRGNPILLVRIPEQSVKPAHRRGKSIEFAWVRSNGTTRKASRPEIASLMLHSAQPRWEDLFVSGLMTLDDTKTALDVVTICKLLQRPTPSDSADFSQWLIAEGMAKEEGRGYYLTNFGAMAAARSLESFDGLKRKSVRIIRYKGKNKIQTIDEINGQKGYAIGFEGIINYLHRILPKSEVIEQSLRTTVTMYPDIALRELIANALIHQDFTVSGTGPMIEIYEDRIEITNPGNLLSGKKLDRLIGSTPESRNEKLASSFRRYRICEEQGTGFQKVVQAIELFGLPPLRVAEIDNSFRVTLFAPRPFSEMDLAERVEAAYQHSILQYLSNTTLTNSTLRTRFKLSERAGNQITNVIAEAVSENRLKRKDDGRGKKFAEYWPYWA